MKTVLLWFTTAFVVLFFVGLLRTCTDASRSAMALETIDDNVGVDHSGQKYYLTYRCNGATLYQYDIDQGQLSYIAPRIRLLRDALAANQHRDHILTPEMGAGFLGGAAGVWSFADVLVMIRTSEGGVFGAATKKLMAGTIGALSGYSAGYYTGRRCFAGCDSKAVHSLLWSTSLWRKLAAHQWYMGFLPLQESLRGASKPKMDPHRLRLLNLAFVITDRDPDTSVVTSKDFDLLNMLRETNEKLRRQ
jgi:hypothetical protein